MAPPALNLSNAAYNALGIFSTSASPLKSPNALSCRSPRTPLDGTRPLLPPPRRGSTLLELLHPHSSPDSRPPPSSLDEKTTFKYDDEDTAHEDSPTDAIWFLPHSPGLPPPPPPQAEDGKLGVLSAINIIVGKTMGVGAYSVPSAIFAGVGSVGMTLTLWIFGSLISFCGLAVYMDLGAAIPRSGGERIYLERIFKKPFMLATCMFMSYAVLLGFSTPNAIVLGEHALYVTGQEEGNNRWIVRLIAVLAVSAPCYIHARHPRAGLTLINVLGIAKILILVVVVLSGIAGALLGVGVDRDMSDPSLDAAMAGEAPVSSAMRNFSAIWEGSSTQPYDYATALLKVLYCFRGYSTANQVLSDVRDPVRTLKVAAPVALGLVSVAYLAINVAFFLVVDKDEFRSAGVVVAEVFFRKIFGEGLGVHILPLFVVVSAAGNIAATAFAQARVNEELAKEGILPAFWLSKPKPSSTTPSNNDRRARSTSPSKSRNHTKPSTTTPPSRGLLLHWAVSVAAIIIPPPGKLYNFLVDIGSYPVSIISVAVSLGLLYLHSQPSEHWRTPFRAPRAAIVVFAASNCLLLVLPWIPPRSGLAEDGDGGRFPSWAYPATSLGVLGLGAVYWLFWRRTETAVVKRAAAALEDAGRVTTERRACCGNDDEDDDDQRSSTDSEDTLFSPMQEGEPRRKSLEAEAEAAMLLQTVGAANGGACGCRACPQLRRRAVCGCSSCPALRKTGD